MTLYRPVINILLHLPQYIDVEEAEEITEDKTKTGDEPHFASYPKQAFQQSKMSQLGSFLTAINLHYITII